MNEIPYDYTEFQRRVHASAQRRSLRRRALSVAACCATVFVAAAAWWSRTPATERQSVAALIPAQALATAPLLTEPPADPAIVRVASGMAASRLEDRIAALDDQLNEAQFGGDTLSRIHSLRSERMQLLDSLVRVQYAERLAASVR